MVTVADGEGTQRYILKDKLARGAEGLDEQSKRERRQSRSVPTLD